MNWIFFTISVTLVTMLIALCVYIFIQNRTVKSDVQDFSGKLNNLVQNINNAQYYEYTFDKQQETNIKNVDKNVEEIEKSIKVLQSNIKYLHNNIVNNTSNVVFEGDKTPDDKGLAALNFNGNKDKVLDKNKGRWRIVSDQRAASDKFGFDYLDNQGVLKNYMWMSDKGVSLNEDKLLISRNYKGHPEVSVDRAEISNDVNSFKKLMIVGNRSSGEGIRKVGIWDHLDVHGNQSVNGYMTALRAIGRDGVVAGNNQAWMSKDGNIGAKGSIEGNIIKGNEALCINEVCLNKSDLIKIKNSK